VGLGTLGIKEIAVLFNRSFPARAEKGFDFLIPSFRSSLSYTGLQMPMSFMDLGVHTNNG
jgi:hypothetical protein